MSSPTPPLPSSRETLWPYRILIVALLLGALFRLCTSEFTWWDDQMTVHQNPGVANPTFNSIAFFWTTPLQGLYVPVTFTTWALIGKLAYIPNPIESAIFLNPWFFHSANVLLHLGSTLMVFSILHRLFRRADAAFIGALFFGLHPVQVETIGWISGMKDLLCWMFALAVTLLYVKRIQSIQGTTTPAWKSWELPACCVLLILGILSKPTAIVTPAALVVIDGLMLRNRWVRPLLESIPLFAITLGGAVIARIAQYVDTVEHAALWQRPFIIGDNIAFYLGKIVWPYQLGIDYSRTIRNIMGDPNVYWRWSIPAILAGLILYRWHRWPAVVAGAAIFLIGFSPVSGLVTFQMQYISYTTDHYLYYSVFGLAIIVAFAVTKIPARVIYPASIVALALLGVRSYVQTGAWADSRSLFESTIAANPQSSVARNNLAAALMFGQPPQLEKAEQLLIEAIAINPNAELAYSNLGRAQAALGKKELAIRNLNKAWQMCEARGLRNRELAALANSIANSMVTLEELDKAQAWAEKSDELNPKDYGNRQLLSALKLYRASLATTQPVAKEPAATKTTATQPAAGSPGSLPDAETAPRTTPAPLPG